MHQVPLPDSLSSATNIPLANLGNSSGLAEDGPDDLTIFIFFYVSKFGFKSFLFQQTAEVYDQLFLEIYSLLYAEICRTIGKNNSLTYLIKTCSFHEA